MQSRFACMIDVHPIDHLSDVLASDRPPHERRRLLREADPDTETLNGLVDEAVRLRSTEPVGAERISRSVLAVGRAKNLSALTLHASRTLAQIEIVRGKPRNALRMLRKLSPVISHHQEASVVLELAQTLALLGRRSEALQAIADARTRLPKDGALRQLAMLDLGEATILADNGDLEGALGLMNRGRRGMLQSGSKNTTIASIDINRATVLSTMGRYDQAASTYRRTIRQLNADGQVALELQARFNMSCLEVFRGNYHHALHGFRGLRSRFREIGDDRHIAECDLAEAEVNLVLNLPTQTVSLATRAETTFKRLGLEDERAKASFLSAVAARALGRTSEAMHRLEQARRTFQASGCRTWEAMSLHRLAESDRDMGLMGAAATRAARAAQMLRHQGLHERAGHAEVLLARIEIEMGEVENGHRRLQRVIDDTPIRQSPWLRCEAHHHLALAEEAIGETGRAVRNVLRATKILERHRLAIPPDEYMAAFLNGRARLFEDAVRLVLKHGGQAAPRRAFELTEQARARALLDMLRGRASVAAPERGDDDGLSQIRTVRLPQLKDKANVKPASESGAGMPRRLANLALERPRPARSRGATPPRLHEVAKRLPSDTTLVEYFLSGDELLTYVLQDGKLKLRRRGLPRSALRRVLSRMQYQLDRPNVEEHRKSGGRPLRSALAVLDELNDILLGSDRDSLDCERIVIVPHGELHGVPFAALTCAGSPLIEEYEVVTAPSAAIYLHCLDARTSDGQDNLFLGVSDAGRPYVNREVSSLVSLLPNSSSLLDEAASRAALRERGERARTIHISAHSEYRHDDPMESRVLLSDGWLTVPQIYSMKLRPELLVLSGSATGRAAVTDGGDLFGLARGFLFAGASSLLTTLWEVSGDRTADYMERFYRWYTETGSAAAAMRKAALEIRSVNPHPYHWASFVLTGRGSPG